MSADVRREALHLAVQSWGEPNGEWYATQQADAVISIAREFEAYLSGEPQPDAGNDTPEAPTAVQASDFVRSFQDFSRRVQHAPIVLRAALDWVDRAHLSNTSGPENWRNWADDHDVNLINAVLALKGLPPLERKQP